MPVVESAFGRGGPEIVAELGDYSAAQVTNDAPLVPGTNLAEAATALAAAIAERVELGADVGGTVEAPKVVGLQGRAVQDVTPNDGDRLVWSLLRNRWEPRSVAAPAAGAAWGVIYDVDLSVQPSIPTITPGAVEIDGKQWWLKGTLGAGGAASLVHGQGLRLVNLAGNTSYFYGSGDLVQPGFYLPYEQLDGYNSHAPVALQWWWYSVDTAYPGNSAGVMALIGAEASAAPILDEECKTLIASASSAENGSNRSLVVIRNGGLAAYNYVDTSYNLALVQHCYTLLYTAAGRTALAFSDTRVSGWPAVEGLNSSFMRAFAVPAASAPVFPSYGALFSFERRLSSAYPAGAYTLGGLRVLQPGGA